MYILDKMIDINDTPPPPCFRKTVTLTALGRSLCLRPNRWCQEVVQESNRYCGQLKRKKKKKSKK